MSLDERVAYLEGRLEEHAGIVSSLRDNVLELRGLIIALDQKMDRRFDALKPRFAAIDQRFTIIDQRFVGIDQRFAGLDQRIDALDQKFDHRFTWLVGTQVATLVAVVGTLVAALLR